MCVRVCDCVAVLGIRCRRMQTAQVVSHRTLFTPFGVRVCYPSYVYHMVVVLTTVPIMPFIIDYGSDSDYGSALL